MQKLSFQIHAAELRFLAPLRVEMDTENGWSFMVKIVLCHLKIYLTFPYLELPKTKDMVSDDRFVDILEIFKQRQNPD